MPRVSDYAQAIPISKVKEQYANAGTSKGNFQNLERLYPNAQAGVNFTTIRGVVVCNPIQFDISKSDLVISDNYEALKDSRTNDYRVIYYYSLEKSPEILSPSEELLSLPEDNPKFKLMLVNLAQGIGGGRIIIDCSKQNPIPSKGDIITIQAVSGDLAYHSTIINVEQTTKDLLVSKDSAKLKNKAKEGDEFVSRADSTTSEDFPVIDISSGGGSPYPNSLIDLPKAITDQGTSVEYSDYIKFNGTLAWRNNNPGNLRLSKPANYYGALSRDEKKFLQFPTEKDGFNALLIYIKTWKKDSLRKFIYQYAPPNENNTSGYLDKVANKLQVDPDIAMSELNDQQRYNLALEIKKIEGWNPGKIQYKSSGNINSVGVI
jgi:hypothetical protein